MKIVLDTNVLLMSLPKLSPYRPIFDNLLNGTYELVLTESIFQEYKEIIGQKTTEEIAENLSELFKQLKNVKLVKVYYHWNLIERDPDDNKFVDCAITANAKFLVSNDKHFNSLKRIDFPKVDLISADTFLEEVKKL